MTLHSACAPNAASSSRHGASIRSARLRVGRFQFEVHRKFCIVMCMSSLCLAGRRTAFEWGQRATTVASGTQAPLIV
ncbi:hypothetical protein WI30_22350 [Burkholderia ubonensis]|nr:hypothetical protein WI30_22350 [Burkholderia ubonensis]